ncbi:hypothetical protein [Reyranella sp.]|uniref:hypothetical protein n=1 Tax=Reyranella sp. TaxID=1929291 RepID=UPI00121E8E10|nr:hypothetical protein [Reyranella sp.]TAJ81793.1 MAG: hypothetical protein EPO50_28695 [Reyranella sp.]
MIESAHSLPVQTSSILKRLDSAHHRHCRRRTLVILVAVAFTCGLALNWHWLVVVGVGSLLLAAFLRLAVCAVGLGKNLDSDRSFTTAAGPSSTPFVGRSPQ